MKRHAGIAVAALCGFACQAHAQSSVTLYGMIDITMDISNQGNGTLARLISGGVAGSRFGLAGVEDLGGGYKTIFRIENGFASNSGVIQQGGALFGRQAWVGLQGPQGTLTFGRQYAPEFLAVSEFDAFYASLGGSFWNIDRTLPNGTVQSTLMTDIMTSRTNNSVVYTSPTIGGVSVGLMMGLGGVPGSLSSGSTLSGALNYSYGPLSLHGGYLHMKDASDPGFYEEWGIGGIYAIGAAKLYAGYTKDIYSDATSAATIADTLRYAIANIGLKYQIAPSLTLIAQASKIIDTSDHLAHSQNAYVGSAELSYQLSKRTSVYGAYSQVNNKNGSAYSLGGAVYYGGATKADRMARVFQLGMRTTF